MNYAESQEKEVVDWRVLLTDKTPDWERFKKLAEDWNTCSIGQLSIFIPRQDEDIPIDEKLYNLGLKFNDAIKVEDAEIAIIWLSRVEARGKEVMLELRNKMAEDLAALRAEIKLL